MNMSNRIAKARIYLDTPLMPGSAARLLVGRLPTVALAIMVAVVLVHVFSPAGLSMADLVAHVLTVWLGFLLGMILAGWLLLKIVPRRAEQATVGLLWAVSGTGFLFGLFLVAGLDSLGFLSEAAARAESLHGSQSMLLRLIPVWVLVTAFLTRSEVLKAYELRFDAIEVAARTGSPAISKPHTVTFGQGKSSLSLEVTSILAVSAEENYCSVVSLENGKVLRSLVRMTLRSAVDQLPEAGFIRVHRSHVINSDRVWKIRRRGRQFFVVLHDQLEEIAVSRHRLNDVLARLEKPARR